MTDEPATGAARRRRLGAFGLVAVLVAGGIAWWLSDGDAESAVRERIEAVAGVTAAEPGPDGHATNYLVEFDAGISADDLSSALDKVASISGRADAHGAPNVGQVDKVQFVLAPHASTYDKTAAVITAIAAIHPAEISTLPWSRGPAEDTLGGPADIRLDEDADVLGSTRALLEHMSDAGVDDLDLFDGSVTVGVREEHNPEVRIYDELTVSEAQNRLATLVRAISASSGTLYRASLHEGSVNVAMSVARRSDMVSVRRALFHAFGSELGLTLRSPDLEISGSEDPSCALRFADVVVDAGAQIEWIRADCSGGVQIAANEIETLNNVVELTRDPNSWRIPRNAPVTITQPSSAGQHDYGFESWMDSADVRQLRNNLPLINALWQAGYASSYSYGTDVRTDGPQALKVVALPNARGTPEPVDKLIQLLRTGRWPGTIRLEIYADGRQQPPIAFSTTVTGPAQDVSDPQSVTAPRFVHDWKATAR
jgi:hypothetical protein